MSTHYVRVRRVLVNEFTMETEANTPQEAIEEMIDLAASERLAAWRQSSLKVSATTGGMAGESSFTVE